MWKNIFRRKTKCTCSDWWKICAKRSEATSDLFNGWALKPKLCLILIAPPVGEVAVFIVSASLVIEAVDHFMADHHTYRTIIESVVGVDVEVWRLQYSGRETYFVDEKALDKLASLRVKIGYPDKWKDYSEIHIDPSRAYAENVLEASRWFTRSRGMYESINPR